MNRTTHGAALSIAIVLGCGVTAAGPVVPRIDAIDITPARLTLQPFQSGELDVLVVTSRGDSGAMEGLVWSATGGVITGNFLIGGVRRVTYQAPQQPGTYYLVIATTTGAPADTASMTVTTTVVPVYTVTVSPSNVSLVFGDTTRLRVRLTDSTGSALFGRPITWLSSDNGVATVDAAGFVRGITAGSVTITATTEEHSSTAVVTVNPAPAASVK
jgi:Bacterial Ig-like domain (group 2)